MTTSTPLLPDPLPAEPFATFERWFIEAMDARATANPNAMCVATVDETGRPRARIVLCKLIDSTSGHVVFFTNYSSAKGQQLTATPWAEAVLLFDAQDRQVRLQGPVVRSPSTESDAYFASRDRDSRIGAWASQQSQPVDSRDALIDRFTATGDRFANGDDVPRPPHWGGWRLWPQRVELWVSGPARIHDRAVWERQVTPHTDEQGSADTGPWTVTRLQP
ncbi:MAG: pyridoxamine 5'-phosphate oxidase [Pseudomonadota bacterium]